MTTTRTTSLTRSRDDRVIAGVCSGLARYLGISPRLVRVLAVLSILLPGPQLLAYVIAWILIPQDPAQGPDLNPDHAQHPVPETWQPPSGPAAQ